MSTVGQLQCLSFLIAIAGSLGGNNWFWLAWICSLFFTVYGVRK